MAIKFKKFCCCCNLRTGSLVIGTLGWVFVFAEIANIIRMHNADSYLDDYDYDSEDAIWVRKYAKNMIYVQISHTITNTLVSALLVYGVYKANRRCILPWLIYKAVELGLLFILAGFLLIFACTGDGVAIILFLLIGALVGIYWYFWLCVWCHYKEIGEILRPTAPSINTAPCDSVYPPKYAHEMTDNPV